ncbi:TIGR02679 family protein [Streptomyces sp. NPDC055400]
MSVDVGRLQRLLGDSDLTWLVERARRRMAREEPLTGPVTLAAPTPPQRAAVERLLGRAPRAGRSLTVRLDALDELLRRSGVSPEGLAAALVALGGPVEPISAARERETRAWDAAYAPLGELSGATSLAEPSGITRLAEPGGNTSLAEPVGDTPLDPADSGTALGEPAGDAALHEPAGATSPSSSPALAVWSERLPREGLVRRLAGDPHTAALLVEQTVRALRELPAEPPLALSTFAARVLGDAHALDDGRPLATVLLSGVRALTGHPPGSGAQWRRDAWASAGLLRDDVSSTVLTQNLRGTPALEWHADAGEPAVLTLRQLNYRPIDLTARSLWVCENPAVLSAAADAHGPHCPPLICLQGQPSAAALTLLRRAHAQGVTLHYHGDFDWGGLRIAAGLLRHVPWRPWRYRTADYRQAAHRPGLPPLAGTPVAAPWDSELAPALREFGVRVEEETVMDALVKDLGMQGIAPVVDRLRPELEQR